MAKYNSGFNYNSKVIYNSATYFIIEVSDSGNAQEGYNINVTLPDIPDTGTGVDSAASIIYYDADVFFVVDTDGMLQPLGVFISDNRQELMPATRDISGEIPGRHGEIDFGTEFKSRLLELTVNSEDGLNPLQKGEFRRKCAAFLNPTKGIKKIIFLDDPDVIYNVKYSGKIDPTQYPSWMQFVIPFKMYDPLIHGINEKSHAGSGTITNSGSFETEMTIEIAGPITNPSLTVGSDTLSYTGTINDGQTLIVKTLAKTAVIGSTNALSGWNDKFPLLQPGDTTVNAGDNVTIKWTDKYL